MFRLQIGKLRLAALQEPSALAGCSGVCHHLGARNEKIRDQDFMATKGASQMTDTEVLVDPQRCRGSTSLGPSSSARSNFLGGGPLIPPPLHVLVQDKRRTRKEGLRSAAGSELERIQLLLASREDVKAHTLFPREELRAQTSQLESP